MANYPYVNYPQPAYPNNMQPTYQSVGWQQPSAPQPAQPQAFQVAPQPAANQSYGQSTFLCIPVTSRAEAEAQRVEAFGPAFIMPDPGHGAIYYKKFNANTALADFIEFRAVQEQNDPQTANAPQIDFSTVLGAIGSFNGRFDAMGEKLDFIADRLGSVKQYVDADDDPESAPAPKKGGSKK